MNRHNVQRMLHRHWPHLVLAVRGTVAAVTALAALRETTVRLEAVIQRPGEILSVLEDLSKILCKVIEAPHDDYSSSVQAVLPAKFMMHHPSHAIAVY